MDKKHKVLKLKNGGVALVDASDFKFLKLITWRRRDESHTSYAFTVKRNLKKHDPNRKLKYIYMHRMILGLTDPKVKVDHINHNGLDNRRSNIRACSHKENMQNRRKIIKS